MKNNSNVLRNELFVDRMNTFAILDGASVPGLLTKLNLWKPEYECLYRGELKPDLAAAAPYLVLLDPEAEITNWILSEGWGNHWGIFAITEAALQPMRNHLRRLLTVHDESGKPLLFRFYDPRVIRVYLPTCNAEELGSMFGPITSYVAEGEEPTLLSSFRSAMDKLVVQLREIKG